MKARDLALRFAEATHAGLRPGDDGSGMSEAEGQWIAYLVDDYIGAVDGKRATTWEWMLSREERVIALLLCAAMWGKPCS